jgi:4-oxalocrotonate tautomerase
MPLIIVKMLSGRTTEQKRQLAQEITEVVSRVAGAPADQVDVIIEEHERDGWATGGVLYSEK